MWKNPGEVTNSQDNGDGTDTTLQFAEGIHEDRNRKPRKNVLKTISSDYICEYTSADLFFAEQDIALTRWKWKHLPLSISVKNRHKRSLYYTANLQKFFYRKRKTIAYPACILDGTNNSEAIKALSIYLSSLPKTSATKTIQQMILIARILLQLSAESRLLKTSTVHATREYIIQGRWAQ